ncbi:MAG: PQQ-binding-like beta-propeller repeat protein [Verrucomicrobium sp.]|nr:PQQ-binding-like beta-propeller repeat protein [Verrucomicrobium sp.]
MLPIPMVRRHSLGLCAALVAALGMGPVGGWAVHGAADWPQWRGPTRTGHPAADEAPLMTLPASPRVVWSVEAGPGYASPVVAGDRVFVAEAQGGKEVLRALDATSGTERWKAVVDETFTDSQGPAAPRCTPVVSEGRVFAQSCRGRLACFRASDGQPLWAVDYTKDFGAVFVGEKGNSQGAMRHGNNGSPWVEAGWLWASAGSTNGAAVVALDPATGTLRWKSGNEVAAYAAPMVGTLDGVRQVVDFMADAAVGFEAQTGRVLWRHPLKTAFSRHVMTPLLLPDRVILGSHQTGLLCLQVRRDGGRWSVSEAWNSKEAAPNFSCPILVGDRIVGLGPQREVVCIGRDDGKLRWRQSGWITSAADKAHAGFIAAGDSRVLMLTDGGELMLFDTGGTTARELGRAQVAGVNWCNPALSGGRLYLRDGWRDTGRWRCVELRTR